MRYYLIAGEASGDLHASRLMQALKAADSQAEFRFFGGDLMKAVGGELVKHYREMAYMGFVPVLLHLRAIFRNMTLCRQDIVRWSPDVVVLVDYPGFNLRIARFVSTKTSIPVYYYISPKIWAWKEWRIKSIRRYVDEMFSILPFEVGFYSERHHYPVHYVGNPTAEEVTAYQNRHPQLSSDLFDFCRANHLSPEKPLVALLAGSRRQEIKDNLPAMIAAAAPLTSRGYQLVVAGAPAIPADYYQSFVGGKAVTMVFGETYRLLSHATAALVTSGTATLETALFNVPQVVCYRTPLPHLMRFGFEHVIHCPYISLVNLIAGKEVVPELFADRFSVGNIRRWLFDTLPGGSAREAMLQGYAGVRRALGSESAPQNAARLMVDLLSKGKGNKQESSS